MKNILIFCLVIWCFFPQNLSAQQDSTNTQIKDSTKNDSTTFKRHTVYIEMFGNAISASLNYEIRFAEELSLRVGLGSIVMINALRGSGDHLVELGFGGCYSGTPSFDVGGSGVGRSGFFSTLLSQ